MPSASKNIFFVFTSVNKTLTGGNTGYYLPEAAHPYYILAPSHTITFASPLGENPPVDEYSVQSFTDDESDKFLKDDAVLEKLASAKKLSELSAKDFGAIFYVGGHGPVIYLPTDADNIKLANEFFQAGKLTAAVCHGFAALANVVDAEGKSIFAGRKATAFSNFEEEQAGKVEDVPFLLESRIIELGSIYSKAAEPWASHVVTDGNLVTGQNPGSATAIGKLILDLLK